MEVVVFTMKGCPHCDELKKILIEKKITFTEKDVDDNEEIYRIITANKTMYGPAVAEQITMSNKKLPPKIIDLFDKIKAILTN